MYCRQYAAIAFIENIRFDLSRKKLAYLTFADFVYCSMLMLSHWSHSSLGKSHCFDPCVYDLC